MASQRAFFGTRYRSGDSANRSRLLNEIVLNADDAYAFEAIQGLREDKIGNIFFRLETKDPEIFARAFCFLLHRHEAIVTNGGHEIGILFRFRPDEDRLRLA